MTTSPFFTIIVPCYNQAQYLEEAVNSVLAQSYSNWECIIVDDGSPDNTEEIALKLEKKDSRIKYLKKENGGIADARNYGIERAQSEWILPLDGDDKICEFYLEYAQREIQRNKKLGVIYCRVSFFGEMSGEWILPDYDFYKMLVENQIFASAIYRKSDWLRVGGYDTKMVYGFEDWEFWINILKNNAMEVYKLDYIGFFYRIKSKSRSTEIMKARERIRMMHNYIFDKHKDIYYKHYGSFLDLTLSYTKVNESNQLLNKQIKRNYLTKILFKIIRLLN